MIKDFLLLIYIHTMYIINDPAQFRQKVRNMIVKHPKIATLSPPEKVELAMKHAHNLEVSIYNYAVHQASERALLRKWSNIAFVTLYVDRLRSIINNLNPYILDLIRTRAIRIQSLGEMSFYDMCPTKWIQAIKIKQERDSNKFENHKKIVSQFRCRKCGSNNCEWTCQQIRSADEPMTTFISCNNCGNNWKMN